MQTCRYPPLPLPRPMQRKHLRSDRLARRLCVARRAAIAAQAAEVARPAAMTASFACCSAAGAGRARREEMIVRNGS